MTVWRWVRRVPGMAWFLLFFLWELVLANLRVAAEALTPGFSMTPGIVRFPTSTSNDWEVMLLANAISMTPGTLSLEVSDDGRELYVHSLYVSSREQFVEDISRMEAVLLRALR